jgi:hypothetical protein
MRRGERADAELRRRFSTKYDTQRVASMRVVCPGFFKGSLRVERSIA